MATHKKDSTASAGSSKPQAANTDHNARQANDPLSRVKKDKKRGSQALKLRKIKQLLADKREKQASSGAKESRSKPVDSDGPKPTRASANKRNDNVPGKQKLADGQGLSKLQQKMQQKLKGARFRWINETLYTTTGTKAFDMMRDDPKIFEEYHQGFTSQVEKWPVNPVDVFIKQLEMTKKRLVVADMGCGEAKLAATVRKQHKVHSFDLVAYNKYITACNIAKVPLKNGVVDVVIFCLALMGTDFIKFIREANRILRAGGELKIAEVVSRISDIDSFVSALEKQGFKLEHKDVSNKMFAVFQLTKVGEVPPLLSDGAKDLLKPCIYKRR
ncbi:25S rRNA (adenine645-N1)-methyltransferase [Coemansia sp. RSA 1933]|nr:25S rRNA (adenine645-N1)-methyltransferase [Coemansia sp. RSA 1933]